MSFPYVHTLMYNGSRMRIVSSGKTKERMLAELSAMGNGNFDVARLATQFNVKDTTILHDFFWLKRNGFIDILPNAEDGACELCGKQGKRVTHHWSDQYDLHTKSLCRSCNARLGHIFKGAYPTWEEQVKALIEQSKEIVV